MSMDEDLESNPARGRVVRAIGLGGAVRIIAVTATAPADEIRRRHELVGPAARLAVEAMLANVLLSAHIKGEERILLEVVGETPSFTYSGEVTATGDVRARFRPNLLSPYDRLDGRLVAIKWDATKELYRGMAPLEHQGFEPALQDFLMRSQQTEGLVRLGCSFSADGELEYAAGMLIEALPEEGATGLQSLPELAGLAAWKTAPLPELFAGLWGPLDGPAVAILDDVAAVLEVKPLTYRCTCSQERVERTLLALGAAELTSLLAEQGGAEVTCHFCNTRYALDAAELQGLIDQLGATLNK